MPTKGHEGVRLRNCAQVGDTVGLEAQLDNGVDVDSADEVTALWLASAAGKLECVKMLMRYGANVNCKREKDNVTALFIASQNGHNDVVSAILQVSSRSINTAKHNGATPLLIAAQQGYIAIAEQLLQLGADPDVKKEQDVTAFMLACFMGNAELAVLLLRYGANHKLKGGGKSGMEWAKFKEHKEVMASVSHYITIVRNITLAAGGFVHAGYRKWLQFTLDRMTRKKVNSNDDTPSTSSPMMSSVESNQSSRKGTGRKSELHFDVLSDNRDFTLDKTNEFLDSSHIEYAGTSGNRLRSVIIPSTLNQVEEGWKAPQHHHHQYPNYELGGGGYVSEDESGQDSLNSTIRSLPSVDSQSEVADPHQAVTISHQYLRRLERTYEAEFGKPPGEGVPDYIPPVEVVQQSPYSRKKSRKLAEIKSNFKMFYPKEHEGREVMKEYINSHAMLSKVHSDYHIPKGNPKLSVSGCHRSKMCSEFASPRVPAANKEFSYPSEGRLDGGKKSTLWKREMSSQAARERKAIREATSKAVLANLQTKALRGELQSPQLARSGEAVPSLICSKSRDTTCSAVYAKFHKKHFA